MFFRPEVIAILSFLQQAIEPNAYWSNDLRMLMNMIIWKMPIEYQPVFIGIIRQLEFELVDGDSIIQSRRSFICFIDDIDRWMFLANKIKEWHYDKISSGEME